MKELRPWMNMGSVCGLFGVSRQSWYQHQKWEGQQALDQQAHLYEGPLLKKWKPKIRNRPQPSEANFKLRPPDVQGQALRVFAKKSPPSFVG